MGGQVTTELLQEISKDPKTHGKEINDLFDSFDTNKNGVLDRDEAEKFFKALCVCHSQHSLTR